MKSLLVFLFFVSSGANSNRRPCNANLPFIFNLNTRPEEWAFGVFYIGHPIDPQVRERSYFCGAFAKKGLTTDSSTPASQKIFVTLKACFSLFSRLVHNF